MTDVEITENGALVKVSLGDEIVVRLPENGTTGYQWSVESVVGPAKIISSDFVPAGATVRPGMGGERFVRCAMTGKGEAAVRLELRRVWETEAIERFEFRAIAT